MRLVVIVAALVLSSCGGGNSPTAPTPQPTSQTLDFSPTVSGFGFAFQDVTVFQSPVQATATLRWSDSRKDLDLYWTNPLCVIINGAFAGTGCLIVSQSLSRAGTLETVSGPAAAGSTIRLFIVNFSAAPEPTTISVTLRW